MKVKNQEVLRFMNANLMEKCLPIELAFAIATNIEMMNRILEAFKVSRMKLIEKYATKDTNGDFVTENGRYVVERKDEFDQEFEQLINMETDVNITMVEYDCLKKCDGMEFERLTVEDVMALKFMIEKM